MAHLGGIKDLLDLRERVVLAAILSEIFRL